MNTLERLLVMISEYNKLSKKANNTRGGGKYTTHGNYERLAPYYIPDQHQEKIMLIQQRNHQENCILNFLFAQRLRMIPLAYIWKSYGDQTKLLLLNDRDYDAMEKNRGTLIYRGPI